MSEVYDAHSGWRPFPSGSSNTEWIRHSSISSTTVRRGVACFACIPLVPEKAADAPLTIATFRRNGRERDCMGCTRRVLRRVGMVVNSLPREIGGGGGQ